MELVSAILVSGFCPLGWPGAGASHPRAGKLDFRCGRPKHSPPPGTCGHSSDIPGDAVG